MNVNEKMENIGFVLVKSNDVYQYELVGKYVDITIEISIIENDYIYDFYAVYKKDSINYLDETFNELNEQIKQIKNIFSQFKCSFKKE